jgi:hypothetical protein
MEDALKNGKFIYGYTKYMKKYFFLGTMLLLFVSFINKDEALHIRKSNNAIQRINKPITGNTLDSLQGTWISSKDTSSKIIISANKMYTCYDAQSIDSFKIFLTNDLPGMGMGSYNTSGVNGQYLILYSPGNSKYDLCYRIGYLSKISLELIFEGKLLPFNKQLVPEMGPKPNKGWGVK